MTRNPLLIVLLFFALPILLQAQDVRVQVEVDSTSFLVGEWIHTRLEVEAGKDITLQFPSSDSEIEGGEFIGSGKEILDVGELTQRIRRDLTLTVFDTGSIALTVLIRYRLPDDTTTWIARSNTLTLSIGTVALDTNITFMDIKDVLHVPLTIWDYLLIVAVGAALAFIAWYAYRRWKSRPEREVMVEVRPDPEIPAHIEAFASLDRLEQDAPWLRNEHKESQSRLSDILRLYLERRYGFPALEHTTREIMRDMTAYGIEPSTLIELEQTLRVADLAKFARFEPSISQHTGGVQFARTFVRNTTLPDTPTVAAIDRVERVSSAAGEEGEVKQ